MKTSWLFASAHLIAVSLAVQGTLIAQPNRIAGTIYNGRNIAAHGIVHPWAQSRYDLGPVEDSFRLPSVQIVLTQTVEQRAAFDQLLAAQRNPDSPLFHKWLTPEEYADRFGLSRGDLGKIAEWLTSAGFSIQYTAHGRNWIAFSGTAAQVEAAFHTMVHRYRVNGETHYAISSEPRLPAAIIPLVGTLLGLNDFNPKPQVRAAYTSNAGSSTFHSLAPGDLATIYNINPLYKQGIDGTGQKIVIVGQSDLNLTDIQTFRSNYGLGAASIQTVLGGAEPGVMAESAEEADLDLEWAGAIARNADFIYVYATDADVAAMFAIDQNFAPIISESLGGCEEGVPSAVFSTFEDVAKQGNSEGITWLASSGDSGAADCDPRTGAAASGGLAVNFPASIPEVTAVGATEFNEGRANYWNSTNGANGGSSMGYIPEIAWNDNAYGTNDNLNPILNASGGGVSKFFAKPSWQSGPGVPADGHRDVPDIALAGAVNHDPYNIVSQDQAITVGGTSAATPAFAGMVALLNQYVNGKGLGNINATLYPLAVNSASVFHDITVGTNIVPCQPQSPNCVNGQLGYSAAPGYDLASGLGSVDAYNLVTGWNGPSSGSAAVSSISPSSTAAGGAAFTLTVNGSNFGSGAMVEWNGTALPTKFVSMTQLTATVSGSLIVEPGTAAITVSSGSASIGPLYFTALPPPLAVSDQRITTQLFMGASGCTIPPPVTFFATDMNAYIYFVASNVSTSDLLTSIWLAPDGTTIESTRWAVATAGSYCFGSGSSGGLSLTNLSPSQFGSWSARVYDNGTLLFSMGFTVPVSLTSPNAPFIAPSGILNGASFRSGISPGSWITINGTKLSPATDTWNNSIVNGALPTTLDGIGVLVGGQQAYIEYVSPTQINAIAPDVPAGTVSVVVTNSNGTSAAVTAQLAAEQPAFFLWGTYAVATRQDFSLAVKNGTFAGTTTIPAEPGAVIILWGTGFGPTSPRAAAGIETPATTVYHTASAVSVTVGGQPATVYGAALAPGYAGLYQIAIQIPTSLADGDYPVVATVAGAQSPSTTLITVQQHMTTSAKN